MNGGTNPEIFESSCKRETFESVNGYIMRPLQNAPFCPISASGSDFNPRNIRYIPVVKILAFLDLEQN